MNREILSFIKEIKETENISVLYEVSAWEHASNDELKVVHRIAIILPGVDHIIKDTAEEIIAAFGLIRKLIHQVKDAQETKKKIDIKMLNKFSLED
jgi:ABC-type uncharacterized transport system ATPase subunit